MDPAALVDAMNLAQAERQAAREELGNLPESATIDAAEVYAMLDSLGDVERALNLRNPDRITQVYRDLGLQVLYDNKKEAVVVTASPVWITCVSEGRVAHYPHACSWSREGWECTVAPSYPGILVRHPGGTRALVNR